MKSAFSPAPSSQYNHPVGFSVVIKLSLPSHNPDHLFFTQQKREFLLPICSNATFFCDVSGFSWCMENFSKSAQIKLS
ncbi:hypothetical protein ABN237_18915 [Enterobacter hormaechei]|uniref:hypothetical protein n=1 Tax=Enterobacter hormaechei TaxID=158836 RepID=UPI001C615F68